jgi:putative zinc finger/helix-turn-helix YgiT family protein
MKSLKQIECRYCEEGQMSEEAFVENIKIGRANHSVNGLLHYRCNVCDSVMTSAEQYEHNFDLIRNAEKLSINYLSTENLRDFRDKFCLSQRDAGKLIGVGDAAFGKYETGARLSTPTAKLIRVLSNFPEAARMLADEEGVDIAKAPIHSECKWTASVVPYSASRARQVPICENDDEYLSPSLLPPVHAWKTASVGCP